MEVKRLTNTRAVASSKVFGGGGATKFSRTLEGLGACFPRKILKYRRSETQSG